MQLHLCSTNKSIYKIVKQSHFYGIVFHIFSGYLQLDSLSVKVEALNSSMQIIGSDVTDIKAAIVNLNTTKINGMNYEPL